MLRLLAALPLFALAACGTSVSIDGNSFALQSNMTVDGADTDFDGVKLYPGSTMHGFSLNARDGGSEGNDSAQLGTAFDAPAPLDKVKAWYREALVKNGYAVTDTPDGLAGTKAKARMHITLTADGADKTVGRIDFSGEGDS
ncbi:hypothetical protein [Sphingomonas sp.]|uniref:hypothetical protein n=1 Tax=Sphingomonas sp. TaxID=28214 RepID=UPI001B05CDEC|nr:hypothetical protein [Sphingomonas sp.]MBO9714449.1 hypothetical protein [Sphingomonas sp.]